MIKLIREAWCEDTCYPPLRKKWIENPKTPEIGQCAVTALLVQDLFGGIIVKNNKLHHYFNFDIMMSEITDITQFQFSDDELKGEIDASGDIKFDVFINREDLLQNNDTKERYLLLRKRLKDLL